ncbi:N-acetylglucosaminyl-diphospho-decaprenol L-rhamnosyltransferase [bacterium HR29]|jgi:N-acetylglucosaminyl-diphospho-decaprenol L-rhamnosyltransferase|nr:N-acetylglucosaminyl-diphospho-decaprenol L-rhamnosyltransferase [bacterium HR29]
MSAGIVVVTYRCKDEALACLASVERHVPQLLPTTVVVDNASGDGTPEAIRRRFPEVRVVEHRRNLGFAAAANAGIGLLDESEAVLLLNPDAALADAGLPAAVAFANEHEDIGVLGLRVENPDGSVQLSCRRFPSHRTALFNRHSFITRLLPTNRWSRDYLMSDWDHNEVRDVDWVSGAAMLIHRRALERVGVLDPGFFFSIEDVDYCRRVWNAGLRVVYWPHARVVHHIGRSSGKAPIRAMAAHHAGMWRYYRKHQRGPWWLDVATAAGIAARFGVHLAAHAVREGRRRWRSGSGGFAGAEVGRTP